MPYEIEHAYDRLGRRYTLPPRPIYPFAMLPVRVLAWGTRSLIRAALAAADAAMEERR